MAQWDSYSQKSTPADTDTLMLKDNAATGKPNKRLLFSGLWTWIIDKLTNAVINNLTTTPKTVVGGMNNLQDAVTTLNSNVGTLSGIKTVVVNDTTNDVGIITLNVGAFTGRPYVISNISANFVTPYRIICDSWTASTGSISIRVRNSTDNAAVANTTIQDTILIIFSR